MSDPICPSMLAFMNAKLAFHETGSRTPWCDAIEKLSPEDLEIFLGELDKETCDGVFLGLLSSMTRDDFAESERIARKVASGRLILATLLLRWAKNEIADLRVENARLARELKHLTEPF